MGSEISGCGSDGRLFDGHVFEMLVRCWTLAGKELQAHGEPVAVNKENNK